MSVLLHLLAKRLKEKSGYVHIEIRAENDEVLDSFNVPKEVVLQNAVYEWQEVSVWVDRINEELQEYQIGGWEIFQFMGNVMHDNCPVGKSVILRRKKPLV